MTTAVTEPFGPLDPFAHPALFYRDEQEYLDGTLPFVHDGLDAGEPVAVAVPGKNLALIRDALGDAAGAVRLLDMREAGRNPGRIIPGVLRAFADAQPAGRRVRIIGEPVWAGRSDTEYPACAQHEALINAAFRGRTATIMCPYDVARLPEHMVADAYATHPAVIHPGSRTARDNDAYAPEDVVSRYNEPLAPVRDALTFSFVSDSLSHARHVAVGEAARLGLAGVKLDDLALATAELTTNSVVHGGGSGVLRVWAEDGYVVCEVRDEGQLADILAGRRPVPREQRGGRGVLLVNLIADLVRVHRSDTGTTVRCWFAR
ncbi:Anti-sigma regulatory factor (Ser/Thr protein kinase) [Streptomyces sp. Ag82_O1-12]|uniref:sensor histidine kinase n=1 Tax=unclassified Streptomyces TaxID=2593676 RepID=UPI000BD82649|nr:MULTISPECIES: sensor histidine kinase [unclassified Streptomyces]SMQ16100.1 Anti-sigma regulatory factor (Ser/Thr protein kinase) [Streptomyces sp. Ag82_O1-12]SOD45128.1 Anti-sigma regulatory factor (Ser/Thr protein kinase) [Streptomyces sp. Ag82_G6-1]